MCSLPLQVVAVQRTRSIPQPSHRVLSGNEKRVEVVGEGMKEGKIGEREEKGKRGEKKRKE